MGFLSNLFGVKSNEEFDGIEFIKATTGFDARIGTRSEMTDAGKSFAYNENPLDNPNPQYIARSELTLAGELIYIMNMHEEQDNGVGVSNVKRAMKEFLVRYEAKCPSAYIAFMSTAYSSI